MVQESNNVQKQQCMDIDQEQNVFKKVQRPEVSNNVVGFEIIMFSRIPTAQTQ